MSTIADTATDPTRITPETYHKFPEHKALADSVLAAGKISPDDCYLIERDGDAWQCHCYRKRGRRIGLSAKGSPLHTIVKVVKS